MSEKISLDSSVFIYMLFFLPKIMQKACQNSYSTGCQQVANRPYKYQCLIIRHSLSNN